MSRGEHGRAEPLGVPVPPPDPRPYVPSITLPSQREATFLTLHDSVVGYLMHWVDDKPYPHRRDRQWCAGCKLAQTPRWTGFVGVLAMNTLNRFIMGIPPAAFRNSGHFMNLSDAGSLAGVLFTAYRFGAVKAKTNPAVIEIVEQNAPRPLGKPFPLLAALARRWNLDDLSELDMVRHPEDTQEKLAEEFISAAKNWKAIREKAKGVQP